MITNSQLIIVLLIILIALQLYQVIYKPREGFLNADNYKPVNYNTPYMRCDANTGMLNTKCVTKSHVPKVKSICDSRLTLTDGPNYNTPAGQAIQPDIKGTIPKENAAPTIPNKIGEAEDNNSLLKLLNETESRKENDAQSIADLENEN